MVHINPGCAACAATLGFVVEPPCGSLEGTVLVNWLSTLRAVFGGLLADESLVKRVRFDLTRLSMQWHTLEPHTSNIRIKYQTSPPHLITPLSPFTPSLPLWYDTTSRCSFQKGSCHAAN